MLSQGWAASTKISASSADLLNFGRSTESIHSQARAGENSRLISAAGAEPPLVLGVVAEAQLASHPAGAQCHQLHRQVTGEVDLLLHSGDHPGEIGTLAQVLAPGVGNGVVGCLGDRPCPARGRLCGDDPLALRPRFQPSRPRYVGRAGTNAACRRSDEGQRGADGGSGRTPLSTSGR